MCDVDETGESCSVWVNTWHHARKPRPCQSCEQIILRGDLYLRHFDVFDGHINVEFLCEPCGTAAVEFMKEHDWMPQTPASIRYVLSDCIENGDENSRARWHATLHTLDERREKSRREAERAVKP